MFVMLVGIVSAGFGQDASITVGGWNFTINLAGWRASDKRGRLLQRAFGKVSKQSLRI
jgi:hypothetical protein